MAKKQPDTLTSRLKKQYGSPSPEADRPPTETPAPSETAQVEAPKPKKGAKQSVLTPIYLVQSDTAEPPIRKIHCKYLVSLDMDPQLRKVLREASPFSTPLSAAKLIDLVYCEIQKSSALQKRLKEWQDQFSPDPYSRPSTLVLPDYICEYLQNFLNERIIPSMSIFLAWCALDWDFIKQHVTYRGIK